MLGHSASYYLSDYWSNTPLYQEKIIPLVDYILSNDNINKDKLAQAFFTLTDKYQSTAELPTEFLKEYIKENGYEYILNIINTTEDNLKIIIYLIVLIHQLKGSKEGLKLVFSLFQLDSEPLDTEIVQWWETFPVAEENTFKIDSQTDISNVGLTFFENFHKFITSYVYPELTLLKIRCRLNAEIVSIPYLQTKINYNIIGNMSS